MSTKVKFLSWNSKMFLVTFLLSIMIGGLSSCSSDDDPVTNTVKPEDIIGTWYTEYEKSGVYGEGENAVEYSKVVFYGSLYEGGSGFCTCLLLDADGEAIDLVDEFLGAGCEYTISGDRIDFTLTGSSAAVTLLPRWSMNYRDGQLVGKIRDNENCRLSRITEEQEAKFLNWMRKLGLGYDDTPDEPEDIHIVDLSTISNGYYMANDGDILTGTFHFKDYGGHGHDVDCTIEVPDGATIMLRDATIGGAEFLGQDCTGNKPAINCLGDAVILLEGNNEVSGIYWDLPCIYVKPSKTLTITASNEAWAHEEFPTLRVINDGRDGSAIGGGTSDSGAYLNFGNVCFLHCNVEAESLGLGVPIGTTAGGMCGNIHFEDRCYVHAWGSDEGVGVGCGRGGYCNEILIVEGSTVSANGGRDGSPAIGAAEGGTCRRIIAEGKVNGYISNQSTDDLPLKTWINADMVQLNRRLAVNYKDYMLKNGHNTPSKGGVPAIMRKGSELYLGGI